MEHSIFLAKIIGPYCIIVGAAFLFNRIDYQKVTQNFLDNSGLLLLGGMMAILIGLLLINTHNIWEASWVVIITLIGWISLIKGICIFIFPKEFVQFAKNYRSNTTRLRIQIAFTLLFGLFLTFKGYS